MKRFQIASVWATGLACASLLVLGLVCEPVLAQQPAAAGPGSVAEPAVAPAAVPAPQPGDTEAQRQIAQPGNNAPVWRSVNSGKPNYASIPDREASVLIQPKAQFPGQTRATTAGEAWRLYRNGPVTMLGGGFVIVMALVIGLFYAIRGQVKLTIPPTGRKIERFTSFERLVHWTMAISFLILAATGLMMLFGKYVLLPVFGHWVFGVLTYFGKTVHNFVGPLFSASVIVAFIVFVKDNFPQAADLQWILRGGGMLGKHAHANRFNAGEKLWFWGGMLFLGALITGSGFVLDMLVPDLSYVRAMMQIANLIHAVVAVLFIGGAMAHIYIGTIGMQGAYAAMRTGWVDESWAAEHHDLWLADIKAGKIPAVRTPAARLGAEAPTVIVTAAAH